MREAVKIWRQSDHNDYMEGVEQDPVFSLLITALAYQANNLESELEQMKSDVLEEFTQMLTPYEVGHAIPATAVVQACLQDGVPEMELNEQQQFLLSESEHSFIPLLNTRVINATVNSISRIDGRRWRVSLSFAAPISHLSGFSFVIKNKDFRDVKLTIKGKPLPLVKPWDFSELPLTNAFALDTILYNRTQTYSASATCLELFARQNVRMYCVKPHKEGKFFDVDAERLDLEFEFMGIKDNFRFDKNCLVINSAILVNARLHTVDISSASPVVRMTGHQSQGAEAGTDGQQFLHMLRPSSDMLYDKVPLEVRRVASDRFNQGRLLRLLHSLIGKYYTDFYAFQAMRDEANDKVMQTLIEVLSRLMDSARQDVGLRVPGVYLLLRPQDYLRNEQISLSVTYVTTLGSAVNSLLTSDATFVAPSGFSAAPVAQIANPVPGSDEVRDEKGEASLARYYMTTNDRLVTPADMKLFCYNELQTRYGISRGMIRSITVSHRQVPGHQHSGYEILVEIVVIDSSFVRRVFEEKLQQTELLLQSMMSVRSVNIYPIQLTIKIE